MTHERSSPRAPLGQRARDELARAQELQLTGARAVAAGAVMALARSCSRHSPTRSPAARPATSSSSPRPSWRRGSGASSPGSPRRSWASWSTPRCSWMPTAIHSGGDPVTLARQVLFVVTCVASVVLVSSRRASRDRLERALEEVATLAEAIESRDRRLEMMLAASGTGFWEWDMRTGSSSGRTRSSAQHGSGPGRRRPRLRDLPRRDPRRRSRAVRVRHRGHGCRRGAPSTWNSACVWPDGSDHWTHGAGRALPRPGRRARPDGRDRSGHHGAQDARGAARPAHRRGAASRRVPRGVHRRHQSRTPNADHDDPGRDRDPVAAGPGPGSRGARRRCWPTPAPNRSACTGWSRTWSSSAGWSAADWSWMSSRSSFAGSWSDSWRSSGAELPSIDIVLAIPIALPIVSGEATYVEQILRNLLENAAKYSPAGTKVIVAVRGRRARRPRVGDGRRSRGLGRCPPPHLRVVLSRSGAGSHGVRQRDRPVRVQASRRGDGRSDGGPPSAGGRVGLRLQPARPRGRRGVRSRSSQRKRDDACL